MLVASADCSAAFDTISHDILLRKLEGACGVRGRALDLLRSYLAGRQQQTRMTGDRLSTWRDTSGRSPRGVPQGSVWGPILFTLYCADIARHVTEAEVVAYADDITLVVARRELTG